MPYEFTYPKGGITFTVYYELMTREVKWSAWYCDENAYPRITSGIEPLIGNDQTHIEEAVARGLAFATRQNAFI